MKKGSNRILFHSSLIFAGSILGFLFASSSWRSENEIAYGFPVPWAAWENMNGHWLDFVGPLSVFLWAFDLLCGIALVYLGAICVRLLLQKRKNQSKQV